MKPCINSFEYNDVLNDKTDSFEGLNPGTNVTKNLCYVNVLN